ncbi:MAG: CoA-binding protein [Candidatus Latescibacterota bacterium]|nr:MAG: CoA-binding protein [Candidatus Latescibacterota bacterium]
MGSAGGQGVAESSKRRIAIVGASRQRDKFGNRAVRAYRAEGWLVFPVNPHAAEIEGLPAFASILEVPGPIHRVSIYLPPQKVLPLLEQIAARAVDDVYLNPGSESSEVIERAQELDLEIVLACSIVEIGRSPMTPD